MKKKVLSALVATLLMVCYHCVSNRVCA